MFLYMVSSPRVVLQYFTLATTFDFAKTTKSEASDRNRTV